MESMDGISCLQAMNQVVKKRHQWMECPPCKQQITRLKGSTLGWDILFTNDESRGESDTYAPIDGVACS